VTIPRSQFEQTEAPAPRSGHFDLADQLSARIGNSYDEYLELTGFDPATKAEPEVQPLDPLRRSTEAEIDERWRLDYHPRPEVIYEDSTQVIYRLNKEWLSEHAYVHRHLVHAFQFLYDASAVVLDGRMSTTEVEQQLEDCLTNDVPKRKVLDLEKLDQFSSRQFLKVAPPLRLREQLDWSSTVDQANWPTIRRRANWARATLARFRKRVATYRLCSTAKQIDAIAQAFVSALRKANPEARNEALAAIERTIEVDTRSRQGRPKYMYGLPVHPPQHSHAILKRDHHGRCVLIVHRPEERS
jgi:hypothetical protein